MADELGLVEQDIGWTRTEVGVLKGSIDGSGPQTPEWLLRSWVEKEVSLQQQLVELLKKENLLRKAQGRSAAAGGGGSGATGARTLDLDLAQLLTSTRLPAVSYPVPLARSGTKSVSSQAPPSVRTWSAFNAQAAAWVGRMAPLLVGLPVPRDMLAYFRREWVASKEDQVYSFVDFTALDAVIALLAQLGMPAAAFKRSAEADFVLFSPPDAAARLVVEIKHAYALPKDSNVLKYDTLHAKRGQPRKTVTSDEKHVEQLYGYMLESGVTYGVLCSNVAFWPAKLEWAGVGGGPHSKPVLLLAPPVMYDGLQPTVIGALSYLCCLALKQPPSPVPLAPVLPPSPAPLAPMGGQPTGSAAGVSVLSDAQQVPQRRNRSPRGEAAVRPMVLSVEELSLGACLGSGVTGSVHAGVFEGLAVAVKVPANRGKRQPGEYELELAHEVAVYQALAPLQGVHIPRLIAHGKLVNRVGDVFPFIAVELVEGGVPLIEAPGAPGFSPAELQRAAGSALAGVRAMHDLGVAHGDICGTNCLVTPAGQAVWIDLANGEMGASAAVLQSERAEAEALVRGRLYLGRLDSAAAAEARSWAFSERQLAARAPAACLMAATEGDDSAEPLGEHDGRDVRACASAQLRRPQRLPAGVAWPSRRTAPGSVARVPRTILVAAPRVAAQQGILRPIVRPH